MPSDRPDWIHLFAAQGAQRRQGLRHGCGVGGVRHPPHVHLCHGGHRLPAGQHDRTPSCGIVALEGYSAFLRENYTRLQHRLDAVEAQHERAKHILGGLLIQRLANMRDHAASRPVAEILGRRP